MDFKAVPHFGIKWGNFYFKVHKYMYYRLTSVITFTLYGHILGQVGVCTRFRRQAVSYCS